MTQNNLLTEWAAVAMATVADAGVTEVVLCPGARSFPWMVAAVREGRLRCHDVIDERAAAFFALGQARITGRPSIVVCTSGTAAAHFFPAVVEASMAHVPLLVMTADRPLEVQSCGAPQTIDQRDLYGRHAQAYFELGAPSGEEFALRALRRVITQAVFATLHPTPGAVQINARASKPLEPRPAETAADHELEERALRVRRAPITRVRPPRRVADAELVAEFAEACAKTERGVIVAGPAPADGRDVSRLAWALADHLGYPILAEATSQLRFDRHDTAEPTATCDAFELIYRTDRAPVPEVAIQLGATPMSVGWERMVRHAPDMKRAVVAPHGWSDPHGTLSTWLLGDPAATLEALLAAVTARVPRRGSTRWTAWHAAAERVARAVVSIDCERKTDGRIGEGAAVRAVVAALPRDSVLMIGNSMPVREIDVFCPTGLARVDVLSQRGANGIDGLVAGAAGAAGVAGRPLTLVLGDVSMLHDLSSLLLASRAQTPLVVVVVHNGGGRIFELLPIAGAVDAATIEHIVTPHATDFGQAARFSGLRFERPSTLDGVARAVSEAHGRAGCTLIELRVSDHDGPESFHRLLASLETALEGDPSVASLTLR